jgi:hypothetical protein
VPAREPRPIIRDLTKGSVILIPKIEKGLISSSTFNWSIISSYYYIILLRVFLRLS